MIIFPTGPGYMMVHLRHDANICISALEVMMSLLIASRYKRIFYSSPEIEFSRSSSKITEVKNVLPLYDLRLEIPYYYILTFVS